MIRDATPSDAPAIAALWNRQIKGTAATFNSVPKTDDDVRASISNCHVFLVACNPTLIGFVAAFPFRGGIGYRHTWEHTVIVDPPSAGTGTGRNLMFQLIERARASGAHSLWAAVSAENPAGAAFHAAIGFEVVATLPEVGRKFDRWMDLTLMRYPL
ncbi:MAG: GNAT family N-acetyltransferase [Paracoccaceae bacterium]